MERPLTHSRRPIVGLQLPFDSLGFLPQQMVLGQCFANLTVFFPHSCSHICTSVQPHTSLYMHIYGYVRSCIHVQINDYLREIIKNRKLKTNLKSTPMQVKRIMKCYFSEKCLYLYQRNSFSLKLLNNSLHFGGDSSRCC